MTLHPACRLADLPTGAAIGMDLDGDLVCLVRLDDGVHAVRDECTHGAVPLSEGDVDLEAGTIECRLHGSTFDLRTGAALTLPATEPVPTYEVHVDEGLLLVDIP